MGWLERSQIGAWVFVRRRGRDSAEYLGLDGRYWGHEIMLLHANSI
jgi:hypothetical protein